MRRTYRLDQEDIEMAIRLMLAMDIDPTPDEFDSVMDSLVVDIEVDECGCGNYTVSAEVFEAVPELPPTETIQ